MKTIPSESNDSAQWTDYLNKVKSAEGAGGTEGAEGYGDNIWANVFGPLNPTAPEGQVVIGQMGQSLDGRVATVTGESKYINQAAGLTHLHRLRALVDAVVIGVGTALIDDPQLTVRLVEGAHPARVVIDPQGQLVREAKIWQSDGTRRISITLEGHTPDIPSGVEHLTLAGVENHIQPEKILDLLKTLGMQRILIEGGPETVARFMNAKRLTRLHLIVAPIILGSGKQGINLTEIKKLSEAIVPNVRTFMLGDEVLFDCDLSSQKPSSETTV